MQGQARRKVLAKDNDRVDPARSEAQTALLFLAFPSMTSASRRTPASRALPTDDFVNSAWKFCMTGSSNSSTVWRRSREVCGADRRPQDCNEQEAPLKPTFTDQQTQSCAWQEVFLPMCLSLLTRDITFADEACVLPNQPSVKLLQPLNGKAEGRGEHEAFQLGWVAYEDALASFDSVIVPHDLAVAGAKFDGTAEVCSFDTGPVV